MRNKFLSVIAVSALLLGAGLTSCELPSVGTTPTTVVEKHYGVSVFSQGKGKVTSNVKVAKVGDPITLTTTPEAGYTLTSLKVNGTESVTSVKDNSLTTNMVEEGLQVEAIFSETVYKVNIGEFEHGTVTSDVTEGITGTKVNFTITSDFGYKLTEFKVNDVDQIKNVTDGHYETTIENADLTVAATFTALKNDEVITYLYDMVEKAVALEGEASSAIKYNEKGEEVTSFRKYKNDAEGVYGVTTKKGYGVQCEKIVESEGTLYIIRYSLVDEKPTNGSVSKFNSTTVTKEDALNKAEQGKGFIKNNLLLKIKANSNWKVTEESLTNENNVFTLKRNYLEYNAYYETELQITFDESSRISQFTSTSKRASNVQVDDSFKPVLGEDGKPLFEGDAPEFSTPKTEKYTYEFNEVGEEPATSTSLKLSDLFITDFKVSLIDQSSAVETGSENLVVGHTYSLNFSEILPETASVNTYEVSYAEYNPVNESNLKFNKDYSGNVNSITPLTDIYGGSINVKVDNKVVSVPIVATTPELTTITVTPTANTVETLNIVGLSISANDIGCDSNVAFAFEGDDLGCTITKVWDNEYQFNAGKQAGVVKFRAISQIDSSIQSELITIEVTKGLTFEEKLSRTFVDNGFNSRYGYTCSSKITINTTDGVTGTISNGTDTVDLTITQSEGMITGELAAPLKVSLLDEQGTTVEAYFSSFTASDYEVQLNENWEFGFGLNINDLYKVVDGQNEPLYIRISLIPQN